MASLPRVGLLVLVALCFANLATSACGGASDAPSSPTDPEKPSPDAALGPDSEGPKHDAGNADQAAPDGAVDEPPVEMPDSGAWMPRGTLAGNYHTICRVRPTGSVVCWGWGGSGQFGVPGTGTGPAILPGVSTATSVGPGIDFTCISLANGNVQCIGANEAGELGSANAPGQSNTLVDVDGLKDAIYVQAGYRYACALRRSGSVSCWGLNSHKQLGSAAENRTSSPTPIHVPGSERSIGLSVGSTHACVVKADRSVACWGSNTGGELGAPASSGLMIATPVAVPNVTNTVMVASAVNMTCAMDDAGTVRCWGCNNGGGECFAAPTPVAGLPKVRGIAAGAYHACAVRDDFRIVCWGDNSQGQLGATTPMRSATPIEVPNIRDAVAVSTGAETSCALRASGRVSCWGENHIGQLGSLDAGLRSATPVDVPDP
ncbi:hypothetical protein LZC95_49290 [Pendulispora brunnea]|uniref:BNR repeat domain protein n=1 Tax=Pendulispora brunnea TaxID=2905690 RepID=A0ABZ2KBG7_9BACT